MPLLLQLNHLLAIQKCQLLWDFINSAMLLSGHAQLVLERVLSYFDFLIGDLVALTFLRVKLNYRFHVIKSEINDRRQILVRLILKVNVKHKT